MADPLDVFLNAAVERLIGRPLQASEKIGIAVSGGADSMALLSAAVECWPGQVEAATVDHGLREASAAEAAMVADWCREKGIQHVTLRVTAPITGNLQATARERRYALLEPWQQERGLDWLMTGHQANDQLETLLLRLNRGSGISGLASVRARRGKLLRPLLGARRVALRRWCQERNVPFVDDPSNDDCRFDRVRMRRMLAENDLVDPAGLVRATEAIAEADNAISWMVERIAAESLDCVEGEATLNQTEYPAEFLRRLLGKMIDHLNPGSEKPRGPSIDQALVQLFAGRTVALADCIITGGSRWIARRAPPRKSR